ncbi:Bug family tripartite tricarboxylate transporter substrate binding protein [Phaeovulum vinaykumarii]|uniref:Tripartite-type tricarboxylate transporter, receptor component TctC n=1 Tax=Phaeovulum vinaykumarii TaxID=407234 RepID=A0A1N7KE97_9RHOB|nr:tripartite tricarboxylate transporter substrate binding protein [Phaeovulum vinaykumarii]SIS59913.1 Tripartite-type tricarboxylate transporter, receptor component TctC [Phaeovulum vinaykumarii]SOB94272.1 tripartite-type tricarboxylate transporter receptor subunit TctC [Phaeovulum vinaykumarii]
MRIMFSRRSLIATVAAGAVLAGAGPLAAQDWPTGPVHLVVGFPAGSSPDTIARLVAAPLAEKLGQPVVVENKPGAGGVIGVQQMLTATDGHTFATTINGPLTTAPRLVPGLGYDVAEDIAPVALIATSPLVLAVSAEAPAADVADFIAEARANPGDLAYGSVGQGSGAHLTAELFADTAGIEMLHVPFTSYAEVTTSIMGGEIDAGFMAPSAALPHVQAGKMKMLGITSSTPFANVPDVPVIAGQAGMPTDFRAELWNAFIAPAGTDPEVIATLNADINEILADPGVQEKLLAIGWQTASGSAADLATRITEDTAVWGGVLDRIEAKQ